MHVHPCQLLHPHRPSISLGQARHVLRLASDSTPLTAADRHALDMLLDLTRLVRADEAIDAVQLRVVEGGHEPASLSALESRQWTIGRAPDEVRIERGLLKVIIDVAGFVAEARSPQRDRFGRVPSTETPIVAAHLERRPVFSAVAAALRAAVVDVAQHRPVRLASPWPDGRRWAVALSHDLDVVDKWPVFTALRLAELLRRGEFRRAARVVGAAGAAVGRRPTLRGVRDVLRIEREHGIRSTWFILCGTPTFRTMRAGDLTYRPEGRSTRRILGEISSGGHELGLHGSFDTCTDTDLFARQRERLERLVERPVTGVRQHYLRIAPGITHSAMHDAGFTFDSTCGFADRNGFRVGVADVFDAWDPEQGRPAGIAEAPFSWMDRAMSKYQRVEDPQRWVDDALQLAQTCRETEGLWVGIWHPNLIASLGFPDAVAAYARLVRSLVSQQAYLAPIGELVRWRANRARARARAIHPDGSVDLAQAPVAGEVLVLEDAHGREVQRIVGQQ